MTNHWIENEHYSLDPFPEIPPALLNSADITRYATSGCLVSSFDQRRVRPASYTMRFLGRLYSWEAGSDGLKPKEERIVERQAYWLPKNSISYLFTEEEIRLPEYIAARLNFRVDFVHRGMLLGAGPSVDPGFGGRVLIPLHNLTDNDYRVQGGEAAISVEFTKVSPHDKWREGDHTVARIQPELVPFKDDKSQYTATEYLDDAQISHSGVQSAFKGALERAVQASEGARSEATRLSRLTTLAGGAGIVAVIVGAVTIMVATFQMFQTNNEMANDIRDRLTNHERRVESLEELSTDVMELRRRIRELELHDGARDGTQD